jgi:hypothetical protein
LALIHRRAARGTDSSAKFHFQVLLGDTMEKKETIRIELTDEQKKQIKDASGQDVQALEITAQELEQRIAPLMF